MLLAHGKRSYVFAMMAVLLVALVVVVAAGCGSSTTTTTAAASSTTVTEATTTTTGGASTTSSSVAESSTTLPGGMTAAELELAGDSPGTTVPNTFSATNPAGGKALTVAVITAFYSGFSAGREQLDNFVADLKAVGWKPTIFDGAGDYAKVVSFWQEAISQKFDVIVNASVPVNLVNAVYDQAKAAGITIFMYNGEPDARQVGAVNENGDLATTQAESLCKAINYTGNIVLGTQTDNYWINIMSDNARAVIKKYPNVKIIQDVHPDHSNDIDSLKTIMTAILTASPKSGSVAGGMGVWGDPAEGMSQAAQAMKRYEVKVYAVDATQGLCEQMLLPQPTLIACANQDYQAISTGVTKMMIDYFTGANKTMNQQVTVPGKIIDTIAGAQARLKFLQTVSH